ncbi:hypothetical protein TNCV_2383561, partial [Trichonephila clavipes]
AHFGPWAAEDGMRPHLGPGGSKIYNRKIWVKVLGLCVPRGPLGRLPQLTQCG